MSSKCGSDCTLSTEARPWIASVHSEGEQTNPLSSYTLAPSGSPEQYSGNRQTPLLTQVSDPLGATKRRNIQAANQSTNYRSIMTHSSYLNDLLGYSKI